MSMSSLAPVERTFDVGAVRVERDRLRVRRQPVPDEVAWCCHAASPSCAPSATKVGSSANGSPGGPRAGGRRPRTGSRRARLLERAEDDHVALVVDARAAPCCRRSARATRGSRCAPSPSRASGRRRGLEPLAGRLDRLAGLAVARLAPGARVRVAHPTGGPGVAGAPPVGAGAEVVAPRSRPAPTAASSSVTPSAPAARRLRSSASGSPRCPDRPRRSGWPHARGPGEFISTRSPPRAGASISTLVTSISSAAVIAAGPVRGVRRIRRVPAARGVSRPPRLSEQLEHGRAPRGCSFAKRQRSRA